MQSPSKNMNKNVVQIASERIFIKEKLKRNGQKIKRKRVKPCRNWR